MTVQTDDLSIVMRIGFANQSTSEQVAIQFQDEGIDLGTSGTVDKINFTGQGVTASRNGSVLTVNITSGGGSSSAPTLWSFSAHSGSYPSDTSLLYVCIDTDEAVLPYNTWFFSDGSGGWLTK